MKNENFSSQSITTSATRVLQIVMKELDLFRFSF